MTHLTRRELLKVGAQAAALAALPGRLGAPPLLADLGGPHPVPVPPITDPDVKDLALRAVEASRKAGAQYADVRLTHTYRSRPSFAFDKDYRHRTPFYTTPWVNDERMHVGVRALVNGYWGFASSGIWSREEMDRLAQTAVQLAKINGIGQPPRSVELAPAPVVANGHWAMPVTLDPFAIDPALIFDVFSSIADYARLYTWRRPTEVRGARGSLDFLRQEKALATTEGSYCTQRLYRSCGVLEIDAVRTPPGPRAWSGALDFLSPAGTGFELVRDRDLREEVLQMLAALEETMDLPITPIEVGRYDTVCDARAVAGLLEATLGRATELDRALGYEANGAGTSYLTDPLAMAGQAVVGAPGFTVTANRTEPGGAATVQWDDEGVTPEGYTLVQDGVLKDFHTARESASWLKSYYAAQGRSVRSHGCAAAPMASDGPLIHPPNLALAPGREAQDFEALVGTLQSGIALKSWGRHPTIDMDFQCLNGMNLGGIFYKVKDGRCVAEIPGAALTFRAPELWKGLVALGGAASQRRYGIGASKGEPEQETYRSVTAPPALFKQLTLIAPGRTP